METKVIDDGSAFARINSHDGRKTVHILTLRPNHERNKECLREHPIQEGDKEFFQDFGWALHNQCASSEGVGVVKELLHAIKVNSNIMLSDI